MKIRVSELPRTLYVARESQKKTQLQVATAVDISVATYNGTETGHSSPGVNTLEKIANSLGFDMYIVFDNPNDGRKKKKELTLNFTK